MYSAAIDEKFKQEHILDYNLTKYFFYITITIPSVRNNLSYLDFIWRDRGAAVLGLS